MSGRSRVLIAVAAMLAAAVAATFLAVRLSGDDGPERVALDEHAAARRAEQACGHADAAVRAITRNAAADDVFGLVDRAVDEAKAAAQRDPKWVQLASGVQALDKALEDDDRGAAAVAMPIVRQQCDAAGRPLTTTTR